MSGEGLSDLAVLDDDDLRSLGMTCASQPSLLRGPRPATITTLSLPAAAPVASAATPDLTEAVSELLADPTWLAME